MEKSRMHSLWMRIIEFAVLVAILSVVTATSMPKLNGIVVRAAATRDFENARIIFTSANCLVTNGVKLSSGDLNENAELKAVVGNLPDSALCTIDVNNEIVTAVAYMTTGSPAGRQIYPGTISLAIQDHN